MEPNQIDKIRDTLKQCARDLEAIGTEPDALRMVRAAISDLEHGHHDRAGIFARDFIPR